MTRESDKSVASFRLADRLVEPDRLVITDRGGIETRLSPRSMDVLMALVATGGAVIRKYDLMDRVWPGAEVSDGALSQSIFELRQALDDDPKEPRFIETIRGVGFRLIPPPIGYGFEADKLPPEHPTAKPTRRQRAVRPALIVASLAALLLVVALTVRFTAHYSASEPADRTIAVMPFDLEGVPAADRYVSEGIYDGLLTRISRIPGVTVIARTSVWALRDDNLSIQEIARELRVATVITGSMRRSGEGLLLDVQMLDADDERVLWAHAFNRAITPQDIVGVQSEIASRVARELRVASYASAEALDSDSHLPPMAALDALYAAQSALSSAHREGYDRPVELLLEAISLDPDFAGAHALLGEVYLRQIYAEGLPKDTQIDKAWPHARRALQLDNRLGIAHTTLGNLYFERGENALARDAYIRSTEVDPNYHMAYDFLGRLELWQLGHPDKAVDYFKRASLLLPMSLPHKANMAFALHATGEFHEARRLLEDILNQAPGYAHALEYLASLMRDAFGRGDEAVKLLYEAHEKSPRSPNIPVALGRTYSVLDYPEMAIHWYERALAMAPDPDQDAVLKGWIEQLRGDSEMALAYFSEATPRDGSNFREALAHIAMAKWKSGNVHEARDLYIDAFPEFLLPGIEFNCSNAWPATLLAFFLLESGDDERGFPLSDQLLSAFEAMPRMGIFGYGSLDFLLYLARDEKEAALTAVKELSAAGEFRNWHKLGWFAHRFTDPEFDAVIQVMADRRAEQRAALVQWEHENLLAQSLPPRP